MRLPKHPWWLAWVVLSVGWAVVFGVVESHSAAETPWAFDDWDQGDWLFTFSAIGFLVAVALGLARLLVHFVQDSIGIVRQLGFRKATARFSWQAFGLGAVVLWLVSLDWIAAFVDSWFEDMGVDIALLKVVAAFLMWGLAAVALLALGSVLENLRYWRLPDPPIDGWRKKPYYQLKERGFFDADQAPGEVGEAGWALIRGTATPSDFSDGELHRILDWLSWMMSALPEDVAVEELARIPPLRVEIEAVLEEGRVEPDEPSW